MCTDKLLFDNELARLIVTFNHVHWRRFYPEERCGKLLGEARHLYRAQLWATHYVLTGTMKYSITGGKFIYLLWINKVI